MRLFDSINRFVWKLFLNPWALVPVFIIVVILLSWVFIFILIKFWNFCKNLEKKIVYQYDNIFYLWSKYYYGHTHIVGYNPWLIVLKKIVDTWDVSYISNEDLIKETVQNIEKKIWFVAIADSERSTISSLFWRWKFRKFLLFLLEVAFVLVIIFLILICLSISLS